MSVGCEGSLVTSASQQSSCVAQRDAPAVLRARRAIVPVGRYVYETKMTWPALLPIAPSPLTEGCAFGSISRSAMQSCRPRLGVHLPRTSIALAASVLDARTTCLVGGAIRQRIRKTCCVDLPLARSQAAFMKPRRWPCPGMRSIAATREGAPSHYSAMAREAQARLFRSL